MYYATAGQQATQQPQGARGGLPMGQAGLGQSGFPPITGAGGLGRGGPPGFQSRASDSSDFPALGLPHAQHLSTSNSTYASQAQTSQAASQSHIQQAIYLQQQQQQLGTLAPPPPPGIGGPASSPNQPNGMPGGAVGENRDEFPALGGVDGKERIPGYLKMNPQIPPSPPPTLPNGASNSQSNTGTPSTNPPHLTNATNGPPSSAESSWPRHQSPSEPLIRPVQQILSSPVDKWGLKALLYEIKTQMGKGDRGVLIFGEELSDLGVDVTSEEALYPSFVTPWAEPGSLQHPHRIEEAFHIPTCYNVHAPPVSTKLPNFAEDTLFYAFYTSPQDVLQLEVAEELFGRGWRYHTEMMLWLTSPTIASLDQSLPSSEPNWLRGPHVVFDPRTFSRQKTSDDFMVDGNLLESTKPASALVQEQGGRKSPNGMPR